MRSERKGRSIESVDGSVGRGPTNWRDGRDIIITTNHQTIQDAPGKKSLFCDSLMRAPVRSCSSLMVAPPFPIRQPASCADTSSLMALVGSMPPPTPPPGACPLPPSDAALCWCWYAPRCSGRDGPPRPPPRPFSPGLPPSSCVVPSPSSSPAPLTDEAAEEAPAPGSSPSSIRAGGCGDGSALRRPPSAASSATVLGAVGAVGVRHTNPATTSAPPCCGPTDGDRPLPSSRRTKTNAPICFFVELSGCGLSPMRPRCEYVCGEPQVSQAWRPGRPVCRSPLPGAGPQHPPTPMGSSSP